MWCVSRGHIRELNDDLRSTTFFSNYHSSIIDDLQRDLAQKDKELFAKDIELAAKDKELEGKNAIILRLEKEVEGLRARDSSGYGARRALDRNPKQLSSGGSVKIENESDSEGDGGRDADNQGGRTADASCGCVFL